MKRLMLLSTAMIFAATMSMAAITADSLVAAYQAEGYTNIEVKVGPTQIKVEAVKGDAKVEVIYDTESGAILKQETQRAHGDDAAAGVEIKQEDNDFLGEDEAGDDQGDDDGQDDDFDDDDNSGHDAGDDNGDDDHGDDHGSDDNGDDDGDHSGKGSSGNDD